MYRKEAALGRFWGGLAGPRGSAAPQKGASAEGQALRPHRRLEPSLCVRWEPRRVQAEEGSRWTQGLQEGGGGKEEAETSGEATVMVW